MTKFRIKHYEYFDEKGKVTNEYYYIQEWKRGRRKKVSAVIAFVATVIEILESIYLPKEHVHFKGVINEVHENCKEDENEWNENDME